MREACRARIDTQNGRRETRTASTAPACRLLKLRTLPVAYLAGSAIVAIGATQLVRDRIARYKHRQVGSGDCDMSETLPLGTGLPEDGPFMNDRQRDYFRKKLLAWKGEILREAKETLAALASENANQADAADRASSETDRAIELRARDRQRKLISKIDAAIERLDEGTYGYCEETGEPISLKRLDARPIATMSLEAQERHERREKVYRDE